MTISLVDLHHVTHTCPADPHSHVVDTRRRIVHVTPGGPCRTPVTIRCGDTTTTIDCARHEPAHRQCRACRVVVVERSVATTHVGPAATGQPPAPTGYAAQPCDVCRQPLAAALARIGRHVLCHLPAAQKGRAA